MYCLVSQQDWADDRQDWWEKLFSPGAHEARERSCHCSQLALPAPQIKISSLIVGFD